jgi:hypothetical protein
VPDGQASRERYHSPVEQGRGLPDRCQVGLVLPGIVVIMSGFVERTRRPSGEMDEWFKSHAWKACVGS